MQQGRPGLSGRRPRPDEDEQVSRWRLGPSATSGRFERALDASFVLRDGLAAPGAIALGEALDLVLVDWERQVRDGRVTSLATARMSTTARKLVAYATAKGATEVRDLDAPLVLRWVRAPLSRRAGATGPAITVAFGTQHVRRASARAFFRTCRPSVSTTQTPPPT